MALVSRSPEYDQIVDQILTACFKTIELLLSRVIEDQTPAVKVATRSQTVSVRKTNTISERDFAQLDRLIRENQTQQCYH